MASANIVHLRVHHIQSFVNTVQIL